MYFNERRMQSFLLNVKRHPVLIRDIGRENGGGMIFLAETPHISEPKRQKKIQDDRDTSSINSWLTSSPSSECWESWSCSMMPASSSVGPFPTRTPPNFCVPCWVSPEHDEDTPVCSKDCSRFSAGLSSLFCD